MRSVSIWPVRGGTLFPLAEINTPFTRTRPSLAVHYYVGYAAAISFTRVIGRTLLIARIAPGINQNSSSAQFAPGMSLKYGRAPPPSSRNCYIRRKEKFLLGGASNTAQFMWQTGRIFDQFKRREFSFTAETRYLVN
jgi:hypothetical protein